MVHFCKVFAELNISPAALKLARRDTTPFVWDVLRRKWLVLTPEEWVRQHWIHFLHQHLDYPFSLMRSESGLNWNKIQLRSDLCCHNRDGKVLLLVECKAPSVSLKEAEFDQITRYQRRLKAEYTLLSNGIEHFLSGVDGQFKSIQSWEVPSYNR